MNIKNVSIEYMDSAPKLVREMYSPFRERSKGNLSIKIVSPIKIFSLLFPSFWQLYANTNISMMYMIFFILFI